MGPVAAQAAQSQPIANVAAPFPVLPEQISSILSPPASRHDDVTAADVSDMFLTSRSDVHNTLMDHVKSAAAQARSTGEAAQLMGLNNPIGIESNEPRFGVDGMTVSGREEFSSHLAALEAQIPKELISPSGQKLSLTSFPQLLLQAGANADGSSGAVTNVPQGLERIGKEFGSTISSMAAHVGRLFGPSPAYNGPCQCRACMNVVHRLRTVLYENTYHYGVQEVEQELDDRFCYGERWMYRSTCYNLVGKYREMLKILVWLGTKEFDVCAFLFQCYPTTTHS